MVVGIFLIFASCMSALARSLLVFPGTVLDSLWLLNPLAHETLSSHGSAFGPLFFLLSVTLMVTSIGWFRRCLWAWRLAVIIIATQILGDIINLGRRDFLRGGMGVAIAGLLMVYLLRPSVRAEFAKGVE